MKNIVTKKLILIAAVAVILIAGLIWYVVDSGKMNNQNNIANDPNAEEGILLDPPTDKEKSAGDQQKEELVGDENEQPNSDISGQKAVTPVITSWGQTEGAVEVAARVPGIFEDGGTCTLTMKKGGKTVSGSKKGVANVSEVSCGYISIPRSKLSAGNWSTTVSYKSNKAKGTSEAQAIEVK